MERTSRENLEEKSVVETIKAVWWQTPSSIQQLTKGGIPLQISSFMSHKATLTCVLEEIKAKGENPSRNSRAGIPKACSQCIQRCLGSPATANEPCMPDLTYDWSILSTLIGRSLYGYQ